LRIDFDYASALKFKEEIDLKSKQISKEITNFKKKNEGNAHRIKELTTIKIEQENKMNNEKEEIGRIEAEINELILKKSKKKEENVKNLFDVIKSKEDEISSVKIEQEQLNANIKHLTEKKRN